MRPRVQISVLPFTSLLCSVQWEQRHFHEGLVRIYARHPAHTRGLIIESCYYYNYLFPQTSCCFLSPTCLSILLFLRKTTVSSFRRKWYFPPFVFKGVSPLYVGGNFPRRCEDLSREATSTIQSCTNCDPTRKQNLLECERQRDLITQVLGKLGSWAGPRGSHYHPQAIDTERKRDQGDPESPWRSWIHKGGTIATGDSMQVKRNIPVAPFFEAPQSSTSASRWLSLGWEMLLSGVIQNRAEKAEERIWEQTDPWLVWSSKTSGIYTLYKTTT